ncbi:MAG: class I SAM-dependent methyltransferase [Bacteroidota bacterium]
MLKKIKDFLNKKDFASGQYWEERYKASGNSGAGSYNHLSQFKAETLNNLVNTAGIKSIIEFGCGDGNQLTLSTYPKYIGLDVSVSAIRLCIDKFGTDLSKSFFLYHPDAFSDNGQLFKSDVAFSLDVLYHLVEKEVYETYLNHLFQSASKMVVIYAADIAIPQKSAHEFYREFTKDIEKKFPDWTLDQTIKNKYPAKSYEDEQGSMADFFIYVPARRP